MIKNSTILITGGAGFIGSTLANALLSDNQVVVLDDLSMGTWDNLIDSPNLTKIEGSVTNHSLLWQLVHEHAFDYIFHLAAIASVADSIARPVETHAVNYDSTLQLLEIIRQSQKPLKRFIFSSSAAVYGNAPEFPKKETSSIKPLSPYAVDKFASERMCAIYNELYKIPTTMARFFNVYGPAQNPASPYSGFISILVDKLKSNQELTIYGDGNQSRDFVYVDDVVAALLLLAVSETSRGQVYNVGTGIATTLNDLVHVAEEISHRKASVKFKAARSGDIKDSLSDISELKALNFQPRQTIENGMANYLNHERLI
ncbi:MAG: NAD-dependent epimerase/dehydratase family protein [Streptococcaceae bacterium]|jgi:UDP-glucose 4-epimerase|nr:NAD-dependent epimerase/dehydratase family protein [Streptococcaceae bacterium]